MKEEQKGATRASYGQELIKHLSINLTKELGRGFGTSTLTDMRKFYLSYPKGSTNDIFHTVRGKSSVPQFDPNLGWTHYRSLMRVDRSEARAFYEIEASKNRWSSRELERQVNSLLFDRIAKSKDKAGLMRLIKNGHEINEPSDAIKEPLVLEFLGIPEAHQTSESTLEQALIDNLQHFLLELGRGFAFVARQKRLTLDGKHYFADLVLCTQKSDAMASYLLGDKAKQIFSSKYQFHLPTEQELTDELKREIKQIKCRLKQSGD